MYVGQTCGDFPKNGRGDTVLLFRDRIRIALHDYG